MAKKQEHAWELRSFSSGKLKKSSSVEILLGTHPTRGRLLATSPTSPKGLVTSHEMEGSGRPTSSGKSNTLRPSAAPPSGASSSLPVQNGSVAKTTASDSEVTWPQAVQGKEKNVLVNPELSRSNNSLKRLFENPPPVSPLTSTPVSTPPLSSKPVPRETAKPQVVVANTPQSPQISRLKHVKDKGSHLPPLVTTHKPAYQSPVSTPRSTPKGTPIIGKRGHVFSVSTPEVEPETGQPLPFPCEAKAKRTVAECVGDPFEQRRRIKPTAEAEDKDKDGGGGGGGEGDDEPVWQRRLSLLFIPPTEDELEEPEKEPEETTRLLPGNSTPRIIRKQSEDSVSKVPVSLPSPTHSRRREKDEKASTRKEKEASKRDKEAKASKRRAEEEESQPARIIFEEERQRKTEDEEKKKKRKGEERKSSSKFSRLRRSSLRNEPTPPSSSTGSSDEEENEDEVEGRDTGDEYNWDDTICSNRSAYFKKYYVQRGVIGRTPEDKESSFRSPFGTSHNSLSSLIQERMGKTPPNQGKKGIQIGLVVLVVVLLVVIVVGISLTSYFYHLHLLELFIFKCIKFYEETRVMEMYDPTWKPIITLHLGTNLPQHSIPETCTGYLNYLQKRNYTLPHHGLDDDDYDDMVCLDWTALAQLHLRKIYSSGSVQCYSVWWVALKNDFTLRDCLRPNPHDPEERNITWWGGGEMTSGGYPVTRGNVPPVRMVTGKLERDPWGQLLRRMWLSDRATLLMLPARFPGRVSVNHELDQQVCLEVPVTPCTTYDPNLSYTLCKAPNLTALAGYLHQQAMQERRVVSLAVPSLVNYSVESSRQDDSDGETHEVTVVQETFKQEVVTRVEERLENPVWIPWMTPSSPHLTQEAVLKYVDRVLSNTTGVWGHVLLPASWQKLPGEMEFDADRFPDPVNLSQALKAKGFHLALTLHPFVSVDATGFNMGVTEGLWVQQKNSMLPALARYDERHPSVVTDFTNPRARRWYASQLQRLKEKYEVDRFHLQPADAHALPTHHDYHTPVSSSFDDTLVNFMASVSSVSPPVSTEGAVMPPLPPTFVTMGTGYGSWEELETLVPRALTLAMLGYPFIDVGPIGGLARAGHVPDRELYIRWIEAAAFLPAMQISVLPYTYGEEVEELAREYLAMRKEIVLPRLKEKVQDALAKGTPLITPLALFVPHDLEAAKVNDEWMLGNDLLVAPVVRRGERTRDFYLPKGIWKDGIDGHLRNGGRWVKDYPVPISKIPHFFLRYVNDFDT